MDNFDNKVAFITGDASGVGRLWPGGSSNGRRSSGIRAEKRANAHPAIGGVMRAFSCTTD